MASESLSQKALAALEEKYPDWRREFLMFYDLGASDVEIMREFNLTPSKWDALYNNALDSDFQEIIENGRVWSRAWWESQGRKNIGSKSFNAALWTINMKNRFGWSEKTEQSMTNIDYSNKDQDALMQEIRELNAKLGIGRGKGTV